MQRPALFTGLLVLLLPLTGMAQNCANPISQADMNRCAASEHASADKELNKVYNAYRARLDEEQKKQLRDAQLAWIRFRDLNCAFESSGVKGGSAYPMVLSGCLAGVTRARVKQLAELATCKEGDLSCPAPK